MLGALDQGEVGKQLLSRVECTYSTWSQRFKERKGLVSGSPEVEPRPCTDQLWEPSHQSHLPEPPFPHL